MMPFFSKYKDAIVFASLAAIMFVCVVFARPLMPIDETRYMSVAWEMRLHESWFSPLTMNFEPYHHKPPLLFWLINGFWSVFGVSRWAGTLPLFLLSFANLFLIQKIAKAVLPDVSPQKTSWIMLGSVPFLFYGTLVMFDFGMCFFTLLSVLCLLQFTKESNLRWMALMGLCMGMGVLMKGPVAYLYVLFPVLMIPLWSATPVHKGKLYGGFLLAILVSAVPVLLWLVPILAQSDNHFAFWLIWNQTAGRVTGNFSAAHVRPFYFYLMLSPLLFLPWVFFPTFWKRLKSVEKTKPMIFIFSLVVPAFVTFSLISGKQAHYLVPLIPGVVLFIAWLLRDVGKGAIVKTSLFMVFVFVAAHLVAMNGILKRYDFEPLAKDIAQYQNKKMAFVSNYHAELGFLGRLEHPMEDVGVDDLKAWFDKNPEGVAVIRYKDPEVVKSYRQLSEYPYRSSRAGIFVKK